MVNEVPPQLIANRYELRDVLGQGGMGVVHRAIDRLTQEVVALKMVIGEDAPTKSDEGDTTPITPAANAEVGTDTIITHSADTLKRKSPFIGLHDSQMQTTPGALRLTFSREFQTLARLRHPHIISVLDYGFTENRQPFFTMQLLENSLPLTDAARQLEFSDRIRLLTEVLQALAYLHQVGVIHRDLKPDNALVDSDSNVRLLDFGLATLRDQITDISDDTLAGTIAYMAPELLQGGQPSVSSDLYAVGIMAYELFADKFPYEFDNISNLVTAIMFQQPDLNELDISDGLRKIIANLLEKDADDRALDAYSVLKEIKETVTTSIVLEDQSIRESYLQAAPFVGREVELSQLLQGMKRNKDGHGSAWLIGGAVGVGKTRFMDELRIRGLVNGFIVLRGYSTENNDMLYRLWRDPLKRLALSVDVSATEANILRTLMPDIETLLQRNIPDVMQQEFTAYADQLTSIILRLFQRLDRPAVLLLDDVQDEQESLDVLNSLTAIVKNQPLMIIASYRTDQVPDLPEKLPSMKPITLPRLSDGDIESLSVSMMGESARRDDVQSLLKREAEGNIYFLIEVIRALAESAGRLRLIGDIPLPEKIVSGGLQDVLERRLNLVTGADLTLLRIMAYGGRELDLRLLRHLAGESEVDFDNWLAKVSNVSVLERQDEIWRFAHERLREQVIEKQDALASKNAHSAIASGLETIYPTAPEQAATIAYHWRGAGNDGKELQALLIAGDYALRLNTFTEAVRHFERALSLMPQDNSTERARTQIKYGEALQNTSDYDMAQEQVTEGIAVLKKEGDTEELAEAINLLATIEWQRSNFDIAQEHAEDSLKRARELNSKRIIIRALARLGILAYERGNYYNARTHYDEGLALAKSTQDDVGQATINNNYGILLAGGGDFVGARQFFESSLEICEARSEQNRANAILNNLGNLAGMQGDMEAANDYFKKSLISARTIGDRRSAAFALENLGFVAQLQNNFTEAKNYAEEGLEIARAIGNQHGVANTLTKLALAHFGMGDTSVAKNYLLESIHLSSSIQAYPSTLHAIIHLAKFSEDAEEALMLLGTVQANAGISEQTTQIVNEVVDYWTGELDEATVQQYITVGKQKDYDTVVAELLANYNPPADIMTDESESE
ncbi:MAG: tetratricopeptide repeat protein [Chloroflexota bacterium]